MKVKKPLKIVSRLITIFLIIATFTLAFIVISSKASGGQPTVFGYQLKTVLSGSMTPTFQTGSIIAIKPHKDGTNYKKGDVITFRGQDDMIITHRIKEVKKVNGQVFYTTKGDNNENADVKPVSAQNTIGKYSGFTIPYIGYLLNYASTKTGAALLLIVPGIVLVIYSITSIMTALRRLDENKKSQSA